VDLFVLKDQVFAADVILDREFISKKKLTVIYKLYDMKNEKEVDKIGFFAQLPLKVDENITESQTTIRRLRY